MGSNPRLFTTAWLLVVQVGQWFNARLKRASSSRVSVDETAHKVPNHGVNEKENDFIQRGTHSTWEAPFN